MFAKHTILYHYRNPGYASAICNTNISIISNKSSLERRLLCRHFYGCGRTLIFQLLLIEKSHSTRYSVMVLDSTFIDNFNNFRLVTRVVSSNYFLQFTCSNKLFESSNWHISMKFRSKGHMPWKRYTKKETKDSLIKIS